MSSKLWDVREREIGQDNAPTRDFAGLAYYQFVIHTLLYYLLRLKK
jgi:hypothetical protein